MCDWSSISMEFRKIPPSSRRCRLHLARDRQLLYPLSQLGRLTCPSLPCRTVSLSPPGEHHGRSAGPGKTHTQTAEARRIELLMWCVLKELQHSSTNRKAFGGLTVNTLQTITSLLSPENNRGTSNYCVGAT